MKGIFLVLMMFVSSSVLALTYKETRSEANISRCQKIQDNMYKNEQARQDARGSKYHSYRRSMKVKYKRLQDYYSNYDCKMVRNKLESSARKFGV
jgi:hypothetical protein